MEESKLFLGDLSTDIDEKTIREYCEAYGELDDCRLMREKKTKQSRGFAFVKFRRTFSMQQFLSSAPHYICDCRIKLKMIPEDTKVFCFKLHVFVFFCVFNLWREII